MVSKATGFRARHAINRRSVLALSTAELDRVVGGTGDSGTAKAPPPTSSGTSHPNLPLIAILIG